VAQTKQTGNLKAAIAEIKRCSGCKDLEREWGEIVFKKIANKTSPQEKERAAAKLLTLIKQRANHERQHVAEIKRHLRRV